MKLQYFSQRDLLQISALQDVLLTVESHFAKSATFRIDALLEKILNC